MLGNIKELSRAVGFSLGEKRTRKRGGSGANALGENKDVQFISSHYDGWSSGRGRLTIEELCLLRSGPSSGRCDSLGRLKVVLPDLSPAKIAKSSPVVRSANKETDDTVSRNEG